MEELTRQYTNEHMVIAQVWAGLGILYRHTSLLFTNFVGSIFEKDPVSLVVYYAFISDGHEWECPMKNHYHLTKIHKM